ncbi:hypothetical protein KFZ76_03680 [Methylovulum psychrotolerans]|jgi:uncharacterized protein YwqG|uniref:hypothetical protein n=1 Tax=Methylovulum psychrotolerans TaxID=1704499 RepID=UPI001BFFD18F|nr:hypothetical protein [Methylovulum psychrotolerans]MBT9096811.1 hypothetical protein [Methylovulum psychrotolerans]
MKNIPPFKLERVPLNETAAILPKFQWASDDIGTRNQLGGIPTFIQEIDWPDCPCCNQKMTFYAQLDSINDEFCLADCGIAYLFVCFDCNETKSFIQSY